MNYLAQFEVQTVVYLNQLLNQHPAIENWVYFAAVYLIWVIGAIIIYYFLIDRRRHFGFSTLLIILAGSGLAWFLTSFIKYLGDFPRPFEAIGNFLPLFYTDGINDAFPSGHATAAMALAAGLFMINKKWGTVLIILAILVGVGRVWAGVHWPLDVLAGWFIGWLVMRLVMRVVLYQKKKF